MLVLAPVLAGPGVGAGSSSFVHFFVVPAAAKDDEDPGAELAKLTRGENPIHQGLSLFPVMLLRPTIFDFTSPILQEGDLPHKVAREPAGEGGHVSAVLETIDQLNGLPEVAGFDGQDHVDGIEDFPTPEAAGQIGFRVGGGLELGAQGTQKSEVSL